MAMILLSGPAMIQLSGWALAGPALAGPAMRGGSGELTTAAEEDDNTKRFAAGSTSRRWCRKKSKPRIGNRTSPRRRGHLNRLLLKERVNSFSP